MVRMIHESMSDAVVLYITEDLPNGMPINWLFIGKDGTLKREKYEEGGVGKPFLKIGYHQQYGLLPDILDAMIEFGIKPKKHILTNEEKSSLENHLSDMRKIVSKKIGVDL